MTRRRLRPAFPSVFAPVLAPASSCAECAPVGVVGGGFCLGSWVFLEHCPNGLCTPSVVKAALAGDWLHSKSGRRKKRATLEASDCACVFLLPNRVLKGERIRPCFRLRFLAGAGFDSD